MGYVGVHGVATLHRYKYSGVDHSYLAKYVLQPFWGRFVKFFPLWMPPNMITLTGFMFLVASALLGYIYSPRLDSSPPRWLHFAHGVLLFLYQTFDAVDGKQARHSSSPLGELFDHGCDALACAFEGLAFGSTTMCGKNTFWFWVISAIPFYGATWEHYFTNTLILPVVNGPTEGLVLIYFSHFFTTIVGTEWWAQHFGKSIPFLNWVPIISEIPTYGAALFFMIIFAVIPTVSFNVYNVYKVVHARKGSMLLAFAMLCPLCVLLGGVLLWDYLSPFNIMANYPHMVVLGTGLAFGFLVGRMILAHLCDEPKGLKTNMCVSLLYLLFGIANTLTARLNDGIPLVEEKWVLLGDCVYTVDSWRLMKLVCSDCEEQLVSSCSCSDISSCRNSCSTIEVGSVGRISFLIENEKTDRTLNSRSKPDKGEKEKSDEVIVLKWSSSSCIELKRTKVFRRIGKLFRKKREKQSGGFDEKSDMCVSDYMGVGVSRTRSVCSFRASAFTDPDHESCEFAFSSAKISDVYEAEPRRSRFNRGVLDSENVGELKELDAGASIVPSACLFPVKEIDFSGMDGSGFIDLKIDLSSDSKTEYSVLS